MSQLLLFVLCGLSKFQVLQNYEGHYQVHTGFDPVMIHITSSELTTT
jgi:hypothetical protein